MTQFPRLICPLQIPQKCIISPLYKNQQDMKPQKSTTPEKLQPRATSPPSGKHIKTSHLHFEFLTEARVQQAAHLYTQSFIYMNTMWKKLGATYEEVFSVNRGRMIACCRSGWSCIMVDSTTNQIVAVGLNMDLIDYIDTKPMPSSSLFLKTLGKYAVELESEYFQKMRPTLKRGEYLYNYGAAVKPKYANSGITKKFWSMALVYMKTAGFKKCFGRSSNRITTHLVLSFGGSILRTVKINEPGLEKQYIEMTLFHLDKLTFKTLTNFFQDNDDSDEEDK